MVDHTEHRQASEGSSGISSRMIALTPTDVSQYLRLDRCERFLHLRHRERAAGNRLFSELHVVPQAIAPLLQQAGRDFEADVEAAVCIRFNTVNLVNEAAQAKVAMDQRRDNRRIVDVARSLAPGQTMVLFQPHIEVALYGWHMPGDIDILRLERTPGGALHALIADSKRSGSAKVEHWLQTALYRDMVRALLDGARVACPNIDIGIVYRGSGDDGKISPEEAARQRDNAGRLLGAPDVLLEIAPDPERFAWMARDLVAGPDAPARTALVRPLSETFCHLSVVCDGCRYNQHCLRHARDHADLSLLPRLSARHKRALWDAGVRDIPALAALKEATSGGDAYPLAARPGQETLVRRLAATSVGPHLDTLVWRAQAYLLAREREYVRAGERQQKWRATNAGAAATTEGGQA